MIWEFKVEPLVLLQSMGSFTSHTTDIELEGLVFDTAVTPSPPVAQQSGAAVL